MKIRIKLYLSAAISIGLISVLALTLFLFYFQVNEELKKEALAAEFERAATDVLILAHEFSALQSSRASRILDSKLRDIENTIGKSRGILQLEIINNAFQSLRSSYVNLKEIYRERETLIQAGAEQEEVNRTIYMSEALSTVVFSESQKIMAIASRISNQARENTTVLQQQGNYLVSAFASLLVVIIGGTTLLIIRGISRPLTILQNSTDRIGRGHMDEQVPALGQDEFGSLAKTLEDMRVKRKEAESESIELRHYLQGVFDSMPSTLVGVDVLGKVTHCNEQAVNELNIPVNEVIGRSVMNVLVLPIDSKEKILQAVTASQPLMLHHVFVRHKEKAGYYDVMVYPLSTIEMEGAVIRIDDVTEQVKLEEMLMQSEKMLSVGGLAAGMAHELNNPLGGMIHGLQNIKRRLSPGLKMNMQSAEEAGIDMGRMQAYLQKREIDKIVDNIVEAGGRASDIVNNMLIFSRKSSTVPELVDVENLVERTLSLAMMDYNLKKKYDFRSIKIVRDYQPDMPKLSCIAIEIQQVLLNILTNAAQAMYERGGVEESPQITVRTRLEREMLCIEIQDNGPGMEEETRRHIFEPFFTTKVAGKGTGLGLSISYHIVHDGHGGELSVESTPGKGARFIVLLPIQKADLK